jgi:hypothetical protein
MMTEVGIEEKALDLEPAKYSVQMRIDVKGIQSKPALSSKLNVGALIKPQTKPDSTAQIEIAQKKNHTSSFAKELNMKETDNASKVCY